MHNLYLSHLVEIADGSRHAIAIREAVFSPNPMRYRPIWSCDFRYNFTRPTIKSTGKSAPASNWFTVALANQSASRWNYTRLLLHGTSWMTSVKLVCDVVCTSVSRSQSETIMYFTKAASIMSKADILLLVKLFSCN